ncbi:MAG: efflux RND transporter periplasmic adaptor subunit, partial [Candidatus Aminicenantes bacterium]
MILSKKILTITLIVIGICVAVYFFVIKNGKQLEQGETSQDAAEATEKVAESPIPVKVDTARIGELIISLKSPGEAVTNRMVT